MTHSERVEGRLIFVCDECRLGFADEATAKACEAYDREHHACSLEIGRKAIRKPA